MATKFHFHSIDPLEAVECSYGEGCPAEQHFDSPEQADNILIGLRTQASQEFLFDVLPEVETDDALAVIWTLGDSEHRSAENLISRFGEEKLDGLFLALADAGYLSCYIDSSIHYGYSGEIEINPRSVRWLASSYGYARMFDGTLDLSKKGAAIYQALSTFKSTVRAAQHNISLLKRDAYEITEFESELESIRSIGQRIADGTFEALKITDRFRTQAKTLFDAKQDAFHVSEIADALGTSNQSASIFARRLVLLELAENRGSSKSPSYRLRRKQLRYIPGGLEAVIGAKSSK